MEQNFNICPICHQAILPQYYFCPNCGAKLNSAPLSTTLESQARLYAFSIILPAIAFIFITKWPAIKYLRSDDKKAKQIGLAACFLLVLSTVVIGWLAVAWIQQAVQASINDIMPI